MGQIYTKKSDALILTPMGNFRATNKPDVHAFGLWEEAGISGEKKKTRKHKESRQTPHRFVRKQC